MGEDRRLTPSRRSVLIGGASALGLAASGIVIHVATADPRDLVLWLIERALPGVMIDPDSRIPLANDVVNDRKGDTALSQVMSALKYRLTTASGQIIGYEQLEGMESFRARFEAITRWALGIFLPNSNFFDVDDPRAEPITYYPRPAGTPCRNRFANTSPPDLYKPENDPSNI